MGIFSANRCEICGQEKRHDVHKYKSQTGDKYICDDCLVSLDADGYVDYCTFITKFPYTYESILAYSKYYKNTIFKTEASSWPDGRPDTFFVSQHTCINRNFTLLNHYGGLGVMNDEVFSISLASSSSISSATSEGIIITYLTTNPFVPYFRDLVLAKKGLFSSKAKGERDFINNMYPQYYRCLRYPISEVKDMEKFIKQDANFDKNTKKNYLSILQNSRYDFDAIDKLTGDARMNKGFWAANFNEDLGYVEVINDAIK